MKKPSFEMSKTIPALVNSHTHSPFGPQFNGVIRSQSFEAYLVDMNVRSFQTVAPEKISALALYTGYENLLCGNTAIVDQCFVPLSAEHFYSVTRAYEDLGMRAWVFSELGDLPMSFYTKEAYPNVDKAIPLGELPETLQSLCLETDDHRDQLQALSDLIKDWDGEGVGIGVGLSNPVWCSDELMQGASELARRLQAPIHFHAEESPIQRMIHWQQWGMSAIQRAATFGLLGSRTLVAHVVQVDQEDIRLLAKYGCSISHNPTSNLKLHNGIAPIGRMIEAGLTVCLGSDGHSSGDTQSLFPAMKLAASLAHWNGLDHLDEAPERVVLKMARENGHALWTDQDFSEDRIQVASSIGPFGHVWDEPTSKIEEVYVRGEPSLAAARELIRERGALEIVLEAMRELMEPDITNEARRLAGWVDDHTRDWLA